MTPAQDDQPFARVALRIAPQGRLIRTWELKGGVSAQVTALEIECPDGATRKVVVRRHGEVDRQHKPQVAAAEIWLLPRRNDPALLHGDFWPGNVLWRDGHLVGVIDWEDAQLGDPLADLSNTRLEILWAFGLDAMQTFTQHYASLTTIDLANLPYWDLCAALRPAGKIAEWAGNATTEQTMRERHGVFVAQALEKFARKDQGPSPTSKDALWPA